VHGWSIHDLRCPTCGVSFHPDLRLEDDEPEVSIAPTEVIMGRRRPFLLCLAGHRWSVQRLSRRGDEPVMVLLDGYMGVQALTND